MKRIASLIILSLIVLISNVSAQQAELYHRARIYYQGNDDVELLNTLGIETDHGSHKKGVFIESDYSQKELQIAKDNGFETEIIIHDVQSYYVNRNKNGDIPSGMNRNTDCSITASNFTTPDNFELGSMGGFFTYDEILAELDAMAAQYPNLITARAPIGDFETFEGRPLYWLRMSDNPNVNENEPEMLYDAVHHAREPASVSTLIFYMWYLLENYETDTEVQAILNNTELYFVPVVNPDGYIFNHTTNPNGGGMWRKNRRDHENGDYGVDNNRNYSIQWGTSGVSSDTASDVYNGTEPFSEAENQAMKFFCESHEFQMAFNNHTYSNLLLFPFGYDYDVPTPENNIYEAISDEMVSQNGFANILAADLYPASGDSDDWMYTETPEKARIFAFTPEIGNGDQGFWPASSQIIPLCNSTMYMNLTAAHILTHYGIITENDLNLSTSLSGNANFTLQRLGFQDNDFSILMVPVSDNITFDTTPITVSGLDLLELSEGSVSYTLDPAISEGEIIEYQITIDNGDYLSYSITFTEVYGAPASAITENGENMDNWINSGWGITTEDFVSSPSCFTDSPNGEYQNGDYKALQLVESVDLSDVSYATLNFYARWDIENDWDYAQVEVSIDGGNTWLPQCGDYTNAGTGNQEEGEPLYDGTQNTWVLENIDLSSYIGETVNIRFKFVSDGFITKDGFYFDDLSINYIQGVVGIESYQEDLHLLSEAFPNPATDITQISYQLPQNLSNVSLVISNSIGQHVKTIAIPNQQGMVEINVSALESGIYLYQLKSDTKILATRKLVVVD